ncbi:MAG TPA: hypothetical protein VI112_18345, partial [Bacteroidia bacterium]
MTENKRTLHLFTFFACNCFFGGGAIARAILEILSDRFRLQWHYSDEFMEKNDPDPWVKEHVDCIAFHITPKRRFLNTVIDLYIFYFQMPRYAKRMAEQLGKEEVAWIVLENKMIPFAYHFAKHCKCRLHISVHDDCRSYFTGYRLIGKKRVLRYMQEVFRKAGSADVISRSLADEYEKVFGVKAVVYRRGVDISQVKVKMPAVKKKYTLFFAGSSHSQKCWELLLKKLGTFSSEFEVYLYGKSGYERNLPHAPNVRFVVKGTVTDDELVTEAAQYDFAVFFFDDLADHLLRYSISTKLTAYG